MLSKVNWKKQHYDEHTEKIIQQSKFEKQNLIYTEYYLKSFNSEDLIQNLITLVFNKIYKPYITFNDDNYEQSLDNRIFVEDFIDFNVCSINSNEFLHNDVFKYFEYANGDNNYMNDLIKIF